MENARWALALLNTDGLGRVGVRRLIRSIPTRDLLKTFPREQILLRLKGIPGAAKVVERLVDESYMDQKMAQADQILASASGGSVQVLVAGSSRWPKRVDDLSSKYHPILLFVFGDIEVLHRQSVAMVAESPVDPAHFESAKQLVRNLIASDIVVATGCTSVFDQTLQQICAQEATRSSILVASSGLARIPRSFRQTVNQVARNGGVVISPFAMDHGPFPHDDVDRLYLQVACCSTSVFVEPAPGTKEASALQWAKHASRPVFAFDNHGGAESIAHPLRDEVDVEWVVAAAQAS